MVLDLSNAYQLIRTGAVERNVRRIIWRWGDLDGEWEILAYDRVTFGDQIAALLLELVKKAAAVHSVGIDPAAAGIILRHTYIDDTAGDGTNKEVTRFMRDEFPDGTYFGTIAHIFNLVGLKPKIMVRSGESDQEKIKKMGKVLGHDWDPRADTLTLMKIPVNL